MKSNSNISKLIHLGYNTQGFQHGIQELESNENDRKSLGEYFLSLRQRFEASHQPAAAEGRLCSGELSVWLRMMGQNQSHHCDPDCPKRNMHRY